MTALLGRTKGRRRKPIPLWCWRCQSPRRLSRGSPPLRPDFRSPQDHHYYPVTPTVVDSYQVTRCWREASASHPWANDTLDRFAGVHPDHRCHHRAEACPMGYAHSYVHSYVQVGRRWLTLEPLHWAPPLLITRSTHVRKGAGIASSLGSTTLAMLAKGEGLQAWATPTSPLMLRRTKASSMLISHSPASSRAASRQASLMASGYSTAVPWAIQASSGFANRLQCWLLPRHRADLSYHLMLHSGMLVSVVECGRCRPSPI